MMKTLLSVLTLFAIIATSQAKRLEVLFLGDNGHHKPSERVPQIMQGLGPKGVNFTYTSDPNCLHDGTLKSYDALMIYALSLIHISEPTRHLRISYAVFCL